MKFSCLTLFPEYFKTPMESSLLGRAQASGLLEIEFIDLRSFGEGKWRQVDDRPYGGGPGMVLMPQVLEKALDRVQSKSKPLVVYLSPQGKKLDYKLAKELATKQHLVLISGHYEGIDERALEEFVDLEVSVGDFVLTGGEPASLTLIDSVSRFIPGVVGDPASVEKDTFGSGSEILEHGLKAPSYTRPEIWREKKVPAVLLSGDHGEVAKWRKLQSIERTQNKRPELLGKSSPMNSVYIALLHYPMVDKKGNEVTTAVTNLDIHDIARSARTYGVKKYFIVNPEPEQKKLVETILGHWKQDYSKAYHPLRADALDLVHFAATFEEIYNEITILESKGKESLNPPFVVMPDARDLTEEFGASWSYEELREKIQSGLAPVGGRPILIVFGTGWGLAPSFFKKVDMLLKPLRRAKNNVIQTELLGLERKHHFGKKDPHRAKSYNHLSVRSAVAIILDRLMGE